MERAVEERAETIQAADQCYACEKKLERLLDFPIVQITGFERLSIPTDLVLPQEREIYVDPDSDTSNRRVPEEIKALFENEAVEKQEALFGETLRDTIVHQGWQWQRIRYEGSESSHYQRAKIHPNVGELLTSAIEPFLSKIEGLAGQEVASLELNPPEMSIVLPGDPPFNFLQTPLAFSEDEDQKGIRQAKLHLMSYAGQIGLSQMQSYVLQVASLNYEGRLFKNPQA